MSSSLPRIISTDESGSILATFVPSLPPSTTSSPASKRADASQDIRLDIIRESDLETRAAVKSISDLRRLLTEVFLPAGWPHSVTEDYADYQIYDSLQAFCSSIAGLLASRAVLEGVGVGDATASTTTAVLLSILQESLGRLTTIFFAHRLGTALEPECKTFRLLADVFNDAAMVLECLSPSLPRPTRVPLLACASALKALCGVAAGSSKASLSAHFARWGNLGELNAKDSSQETVISLIGMLAGSAVVSVVQSQVATWMALLVLLGLHLGLNHRAVRAVRLRTLNRQRAGIVFANWMRDGKVLSPREVSEREYIFERDGAVRDADGILVGTCSIGITYEEYVRRTSKAAGRAYQITTQALEDAAAASREQSFLVHLDPASRHCYIALARDCTLQQQLRAWFMGHAALQSLHTETRQSGRADDGSSSREVASKATQAASKSVDTSTFGELWEELQRAGWDIKTGALETRRGARFAVSSS